MQPTDINIIIVIPVFRPTLSSDEKASLRQCLKVLGPHHDVALVCPDSLDTAAYDGAAAEKLRTERFKDSFFEGIEGYNSLMMSHTFYNRFSNYDWMLVYQLDAWIFEDRLEEWCRKGYDYVGAPWFENNESHETGWHLWQRMPPQSAARDLVAPLPPQRRTATARQPRAREERHDRGAVYAATLGHMGGLFLLHLARRHFGGAPASFARRGRPLLGGAFAPMARRDGAPGPTAHGLSRLEEIPVRRVLETIH